MTRPPHQPELFAESADNAEAVTHRFDAARLTQARVLKALTKKELAEMVGVSPAAIGQYEAKIVTPRPELLAKLGRALAQDVTFFASGRPYLRIDTADAHFRSLRSMRAADRDLALATAEQIWELTAALERHVQLPDPQLPDPMPGASPREAARALRELWHRPRGPIRHLVATMESHGIVVVLTPATGHIDRVDAFSTVISDRPVVISTPRRSSDVYRHRFTCAHELGHLLLHRECASGDVTSEKQADEFAAEFLTPAAEMHSLLPKRMDLGSLDQIGRSWGVSVDSLVRRMSELRVVSDATVRRTYARLNTLRHLGVEEPVHSYPGEVPRLLKEAVQLVERVGADVHTLAAELHWKPSRIRELIGTEDLRPELTLVK